VVVIGVGDKNFPRLADLNRPDSNPLKDQQGNPIARDCVQFAASRDFQNDPILLANHIMAKIPA
jgi:hypothetical protein